MAMVSCRTLQRDAPSLRPSGVSVAQDSPGKRRGNRAEAQPQLASPGGCACTAVACVACGSHRPSKRGLRARTLEDKTYELAVLEHQQKPGAQWDPRQLPKRRASGVLRKQAKATGLARSRRMQRCILHGDALRSRVFAARALICSMLTPRAKLVTRHNTTQNTIHTSMSAGFVSGRNISTVMSASTPGTAATICTNSARHSHAMHSETPRSATVQWLRGGAWASSTAVPPARGSGARRH
jgi:hypothetical protein